MNARRNSLAVVLQVGKIRQESLSNQHLARLQGPWELQVVH